MINDKKWEADEEGIVEIVVENKGFYHYLAQRFFDKPRFSFIRLDKYGSCVWRQIDGVRTGYEIGQILAEEHGEAEQQLYERLSRFFGILKQNQYIRWVKDRK